MTRSTHDEKEKAIFHAALAIQDVSQRAVYLEAACGADEGLRVRVASLLSAAEDAGEFLEAPPMDSESTEVPVRGTEMPGEMIGPYKLLEQIGEGGFGSVYMADQQTPIQRRVALKVIKVGMDTKQVIARFEAERQALALMDHPNIAKVLDAGATETGRPYFVMELVRGVPVTEYCDDRNLSTHERLGIFTDICSAVQHAHQKGIIHRDIKPSNILVATNGDRPVPKVIDFGIAKATQGRLTDKTLFTQFRQFIGTPAYMSPEQALMSAVDVDTRSDIYSLGVLLYELLTGRTPLDATQLADAGYEEICRIIRQEEPPKPSKRLSSLQHEELTTLAKQRRLAPSQFCSALRGDLDWIVMKAVEKERSRRYDSCGALAMDIDRFLCSEPVEAGPPSAFYYLRKFAQRHRTAALTALALASSILLGAIVATAGWLQAVHERNKQKAVNLELKQTQGELATRIEEAQEARTRAEDERQRIRELAYASDMNGAYQALQLNDLGRARVLLERHLPDREDEDLRGWEWRALWKMSQTGAIAMFGDGAWGIWRISVSPDGKWIATGEMNGGVRIWDARRRELACSLSESSMAQYGLVAFSPDGLRLYGTAEQGVVKCWSVPSFQETNVEFLHGSRVRGLAVSNDVVAVYEFDGNLHLWDVESGDKRQIWVGRGGGVGEGCLAFSPDGSLLGVGRGMRAPILDVASGEESTAINQACKYGIAFAPNNTRIASGSTILDSSVYLHQASDGQLLESLSGHSLYVHDVAMSKDGTSFASSSADRTIRLWDTRTAKLLRVLRGHSDEVYCIQFSADGKQLISGSKDGRIGIWNAHESDVLDWPRRLKDVHQASFSADGKVLVTRNDVEVDGGNLVRNVSIRSAATLKELKPRPDLGENVSGVRCSPIDSQLAVGTEDGHLMLTNLNEDAEPLKQFRLAPQAAIQPLNYSADGKLLLVAVRRQEQTQAVIWSLEMDREMARFSLPAEFDCAALSPDGKQVVSGHVHQVLVWNVKDATSKVILADVHHADAVAWSPDGTTLAIGVQDAVGRLLDATTFGERGLLRGHMMAVHGIAYSADGHRIATGGGPGETLKVWDAQTHRELMSLDAPGFYHGYVEFSPDGNAIIVIGGMGLKMWRVPTVSEIDRVQQTSGSLFPGGRDE